VLDCDDFKEAFGTTGRAEGGYLKEQQLLKVEEYVAMFAAAIHLINTQDKEKVIFLIKNYLGR